MKSPTKLGTGDSGKIQKFESERSHIDMDLQAAEELFNQFKKVTDNYISKRLFVGGR